ncbi:MAG: dihydrofolate reductase [Flavobacteriales bacterium]|nr:dihydrofolate reductase [Flavobacteriales bacterium]
MVSLIVAKAKNNAIGKNNNLLWHLPSDMRFFKETTTGHCIITGRKNYESIPEKYRPLVNRTNIIVTRNANFKVRDAIICHSLEEAIEVARSKGETEVFIIGGGQIYKEAMAKCLVSRMYITEVDAEFEADTFFPAFEQKSWISKELSSIATDEKNQLQASIKLYERK